MAEFKTAEQYVVARCEELERKLEVVEANHEQELRKLCADYDRIKAELCDAYDILNMLRDNIRIRSTCYGRAISVDNIYETDNCETIEALIEYFDLRPEDIEDA